MDTSDSKYKDLQEKFKVLCDKKKSQAVRNFKDVWSMLSVNYDTNEMATYLMNTCVCSTDGIKKELIEKFLMEIKQGVTDFSTGEKLTTYKDLFF